MDSNGSITFNPSPYAKPSEELKSNLKRYIIDFFGLIFLIITLPLLWILNKIKPVKKRRIMVGTHPIVSNIHYKYLLQNALPEYEIDIFIFEDWLNEEKYYDISARQLLPKWLIRRSAYTIAPYFVLLWAYRRYNGFYWHLDGAILERTMLWKIEPLLIELFRKKIVMQAYGSDQWTILQSNDNLNFKFGLVQHRKRYFMMDFKKINRNYMWCKYADLVSGDFRYLPITNAVSLAHFFVETDELTYNLNKKLDPIIISHFANHPERKGSHAIESICKKLVSKGYNIEYRSITGVKREVALQILEESHIFIEHLFNGTIGTGCLEAMAKGNVVFTNIDQKLIDFALVQDYDYYSELFEKSPIINININTLEKELISLIEDKELILNKIRDSRKFIEESSENVKKWYKNNKNIKEIFDAAR